MPLSIPRSVLATALSCSAGLALFPGAASAQSETFVSSSFLGDPLDPINYVLPSFNPDLGTLDSINLTWQFNLHPEISVYNDTNGTINFSNASISEPLTEVGPGGLDFNTDLTAKIYLGHVKPDRINNYWPAIPSNYGSEIVSPSDFNLWEGTPATNVTLTVTPSAPTFQGTANSAGLFFGGSSTECGEITVVYNYTAAVAVPEPSGKELSLIAGAAIGLLVIGRRARGRA